VRARLAALVILVAAGGAASAADDPLLARAFEVRYRPLADAAELVGPLLSPEGKLEMVPRLRSLVVEDRQPVLLKVAALLSSYDLPPQNVEVTFSLFLGTDRRDEPPRGASADAGLSQEVRGVLETLSDVTKWSSYETLGSRAVTGSEGDEVIAALSEDYRVVFAVESVHEGSGVIRFKQLSLQHTRRQPDGTLSIAELYSASLGVSVGKLTVVGAASDPGSDRALFLTFQARPRPR
jgi:hypothetical protein